MTGREKNVAMVQILLRRKGGGAWFSFMQKIKPGHFINIQKFYFKCELRNKQPPFLALILYGQDRMMR